MASITLSFNGRQETFALAPSTVFGRGGQCTWPLPVPELPMYWLELRYQPNGVDSDWQARILVGHDHTPPHVHGWFPLLQDTLLEFGNADVEVMAVDLSPPEPFAQDLAHPKRVAVPLSTFASPALEGGFELPDGTPLQDGAVVFVDGRPLRPLLAEPVTGTIAQGPDLFDAFYLFAWANSRSAYAFVIDGTVPFEQLLRDLAQDVDGGLHELAHALYERKGPAGFRRLMNGLHTGEHAGRMALVKGPPALCLRGFASELFEQDEELDTERLLQRLNDQHDAERTNHESLRNPIVDIERQLERQACEGTYRLFVEPREDAEGTKWRRLSRDLKKLPNDKRYGVGERFVYLPRPLPKRPANAG